MYAVRWAVPLIGVVLLLVAHAVALVYRVQPAVSLWFPPSGVGIVLTLWLGPVGALLSGLVAVVMAPFWGIHGWSRILGFLDCIEPLVAWMLYLQVLQGSLTLNNLRSVIAFLLSAPLSACFASAVIGCLVLAQFGNIAQAQFFETVAYWWVGNALGTIVVVPMALLLVTPILYRWGWLQRSTFAEAPTQLQLSISCERTNWLEVLAIGVTAALFGLVAVQATRSSLFVTLQFSLLGMIPIVWAACRFGILGGVLTANWTVLLSLLAYLVFYPGAIALPQFPVDPQLLHLHKLNLFLHCTMALVIGAAITEWSSGRLALAIEQERSKAYQASAQLSERLLHVNRLLTESNQQYQASEERFRTSVENMLDCFCVCSASRDETGQIVDFRIDYMNEAACISNQMPREAQIGKALCEVLPAHKTAGLFDEYCEVVETGRSLIKEDLIYEDNYGQQRLSRAFDIRVAKLGDGFVATWRDVTDRIQAHEELEQRRREFAALIENSPDIISRFDRSLRHLYISPSVEAIAGIPATDFIGKTIAEMGMPPEKCQVWEPALQTVLATKQPHSIEFRFFSTIDQSRHYYQTRLIPEFGSDGSVTSILAVSRDITTLKQTEVQLRERQHFIERITNTVPGIVYVYDLVEQRNVYANLQLAEMLGYTAAEVQDMSQDFFSRLMHPDDFAKLPTQFQKLYALQDGESLEFEFRMQHVHGEWRWLADRATIFTRTTDGQPHQVLGCAQDITARKQTELALSLANEQFQLAAAAIDSLIYDWDVVTDRVTRTEGLVNVLGYTPAEVEPTNRWWQNQIHPADLQQLPYTPNSDSAPNHRYNQEYRIRHKLGHYVTVFDSGLILRDETGKPIRVVGNVIDISDRKQAENALRESEERLRLALKAADQGLYDLNVQTGAAIVSPEYVRMLGYDPETFEETNAKWLERLHPDDVQSTSQAYLDYITGQRPDYRVEFRQRTQTGDWKWILSLGKIVEWDEAGNPLRLVGTHTDITDRKRAEEALQRSQERLNLALEAAGMGTWKWNITADEVSWSTKLEEMFGLSPGTFDSSFQTFIARLHPDDQDLVLQAATRTIREGADLNVEFRIVKPNGALCWVIAKGKVFHDLSGRPLQMTGVTLDITERKRIEAERANILQREQAARQQAEAASRMKDEFLAIVSHELRSPLNAILGWSRLLRTRKMNPEKTEQALASIERNAQAQTQLIEDLLDISRIIRGTIRLYLRPVNLISVLQAAIDTTRPTADNKSIQIETHFEPSVYVSGDPDRLQQIVWNLLSNAIKFTSEGGRVIVRLETGCEREADTAVTPIPSFPSAYAQITVTDTGKGIDPNFLPHVFDRFTQADSTTTRNETGLGLGLAIVRNLVELHGGKIYADSPGLGQGAIFTVKLPLLPNSAQSLQPTAPNSALPSSEILDGIQVLVVDDEADTRDFLVAALEQFGAKVTAVDSVQAALTQLTQNRPNILLSDLGMPGQDGFELIQQIRLLPPAAGGNIPAAALTAYVRGEDRNRAIEAGFQFHVPKPIDPAQLLTVVKQLVRLQQVNIS
jgi:PAS domain S-box-containing protein